jgi:hypothetical protein
MKVSSLSDDVVVEKEKSDNKQYIRIWHYTLGRTRGAGLTRAGLGRPAP